ncbi:MAG: response regulator, partial [Dehalococcoidia bacterium]
MAPRSELRILIVDDDPAIITLLTAVLTADGFPTPTAVGAGGDALAASDGVDVVLLDHNLPDMQGTEVLEHLNRQAHPPSVVLITAHGDESVAATALRHGAEDY